MRKTLITITILALVVSIVGTGIIVFIETSHAPESVPTISAE